MSLHKKLSLVVLLLTMPALTWAGPDKKKLSAVQDDGPARISLKVSGEIFLNPPAQVGLTIMVENPGEKYYCPIVEIEWEPGDRSIWEQDCPPFEEAELINFFSYTPPNHTYRSAGPRTLVVKLLRGKKVLATINTRINGHNDKSLGEDTLLSSR